MMMRLAIGIAAVFMTTAAVQAQCPQLGTPTQHFTIKEGFQIDPQRHSVTAGGNLDLGKCTQVPGAGYVTRLPDFVVNYETKSGGASAFTLTFRIDSSADTVLLVNDPNKKWHFNDDAGKGLNAKISLPKAGHGRYDIWVGNFKNELGKATLVTTELE